MFGNSKLVGGSRQNGALLLGAFLRGLAETSIEDNVTVYHLEAFGLDSPIMVSYRETFEKKSDALQALLEMVEREEAARENLWN